MFVKNIQRSSPNLYDQQFGSHALFSHHYFHNQAWPWFVEFGVQLLVINLQLIPCLCSQLSVQFSSTEIPLGLLTHTAALPLEALIQPHTPKRFLALK